MSYHDWHVGMKVVCIKTDGWELSSGAWLKNGISITFPQHRQILTIREMDEWRGCVYLKFDEIRNPTKPSEPSFAIQWFRPVQPRATDIAIFTTMLSKDKVPA